MPAKSKLEELRNIDEANFNLLSKRFPNEIRIIDDLSACYQKLADGLTPEYAKTLAQRIAGLILCGHCGNRLVVASTCLMRRYASSMYRETRSALEGAGIAYAIQSNQEMLDIYMEHERYKGQRKKAAKHVFKPEKIFPHGIPALERLALLYDTASARGHMNIATLTFHLAKAHNAGHTRMNAQDIQDEHLDQHFVLHLLWLGFAHLAIFDVIDLIFPDFLFVAGIRAERDYVGSKLARFNEKHKANRGSK